MALNHATLVPALQAVLALIKDQIGNDAHEARWRLLLYDPSNAPPVVQTLLDALKAEATLEIFNDLFLVLPTQGLRMSYSYLAAWLVRRAKDAGSEVAISDLQRYVGADSYPATLVWCLTAISVAEPSDMGSGIQLKPWKQVPASSFKKALEMRFDVLRRQPNGL